MIKWIGFKKKVHENRKKKFLEVVEGGKKVKTVLEKLS